MRIRHERNSRPRLSSRSAAGFSLIELLVALVIGLIIVAGMSQLFVSVSRANLELAKTNNQMESARFAIQFLQGDLVHAGYWGGFIPEFDDLTLGIGAVPTDFPAAKPDPVCLPMDVAADWSATYRESLIGIPVEVYGPGATPNGCGAVVADRLANTDLLIVRHAEICAAGEAGCEAFDDDELYMRVSNCEADTDRYELDPDYPASYTVRELICDDPDTGLPVLAARRRFIQNIYYIRDWAYEDGTGDLPKDNIPTLVRSRFQYNVDFDDRRQVEANDELNFDVLVPGIDRFHVELGIDRESQTGEAIDQTAALDWVDEDERTTPRNRGDGIPETAFERCLSEDAGCTVEDLANVVAVKLYILARANEATPGYTDDKIYTLGTDPALPAFNDNFKRHLYQTTVRINNVAGRRETPFDPSEVVP